jgi:hypothetical protein
MKNFGEMKNEEFASAFMLQVILHSFFFILFSSFL